MRDTSHQNISLSHDLAQGKSTESFLSYLGVDSITCLFLEYISDINRHHLPFVTILIRFIALPFPPSPLSLFLSVGKDRPDAHTSQPSVQFVSA